MSTLSCAVLESLRVLLGFPGSWMRTWDEFGVESGEREGVRLRGRTGSESGRSGGIGGKEGEKTDDGRAEGGNK